MGLYNLHLDTRTRSLTVKYGLEPCFELRALRYDIWVQFADVMVFENIKGPFVPGAPPLPKLKRTLKQDLAFNRQKYGQPPRVVVKRLENQIHNIDEGNRILQEVGELDPKTLGRLKVVGLRMKWRRHGGDPLEFGEFLSFGGKS